MLSKVIGTGPVRLFVPEVDVQVNHFDVGILDWPHGQLLPDVRLDLQVDFHLGFL